MSTPLDLVSAPVQGQGPLAQFLGLTRIDLDAPSGYGQVQEAMGVLWFVAQYLAGDRPEAVERALRAYENPEDALAIELKERLANAEANDWWSSEDAD